MSPHHRNNAIKGSDFLWPNARVPYRISDSFNQEEKNKITGAIEEYHKKTCVQFVPRTPGDDRFLNIARKDGCWSTVGRASGSRGSGPQDVSIGFGCERHGTIVHELMHAVGFYHEQSRADRDNFVTIVTDNVKGGMTHNFEKLGLDRITHLDAPYDYGSVMHYGPTAFSKNGQPTITKKQDGGAAIGNRVGMSEWDAIKINRLYSCRDGKKEEKKVVVEEKKVVVVQPKPQPRNNCVLYTDRNRNCNYWAGRNECRNNPEGMWAHCSRACCEAGSPAPRPPKIDCNRFWNTAGVFNGYCDGWARWGECNNNPLYMKVFCARSCCFFSGVGNTIGRGESDTMTLATCSAREDTVTVDGACFLRVDNEDLQGSKAADTCQLLGGQLASLHNDERVTAVRGKPTMVRGSAFVGAVYNAKSASFFDIWSWGSVGSGLTVDVSLWAPGEPNDSFSAGDFCAVLGEDLLLRDQPCAATAQAALCQFESGTSS